MLGAKGDRNKNLKTACYSDVNINITQQYLKAGARKKEKKKKKENVEKKKRNVPGI